MIKTFGKFSVCFCLLFAIAVVVSGQNPRKVAPAKERRSAQAKFSGVYAGVQVIGGFNGSTSYTHIYYFRPDGRFAAKLDQPDWQTRIDGKFTMQTFSPDALKIVSDWILKQVE